MFRFSFTSALLVPVSKERKKPHITVVIIVADITPGAGRIAKKEKKINDRYPCSALFGGFPQISI